MVRSLIESFECVMGYPAIRMHLEQLAASNERGNSKTKAIGFLKLIKSRDIISMALFLQDILTVLQKVSMKFQEDQWLLMSH